MRKLLVLAAAIIVMLVIGSLASRAVLSQNADSDQNRPIFTSDYTLETTKTDDLFVLADTAQLAAGSHVMADAAIVGRSRIVVDGQVDGDLTAMGGDITLGQGAKINGDADLIGSHISFAGHIDGNMSVVADTLDLLPGATINGGLELCVSHFTNETTLNISSRTCGEEERAGWQSLRDGTLVSETLATGGFSFGAFVFTGIVTLGLGALAGVIVSIFPRPFGLMTQAIRSVPARSARVGCVTLILLVALAAGVMVILAVLPPLGLVLLPVAALLSLPLGLLFAAGWITLALLTGDWLLRKLARHHSPPMLTVIAGSLGLFAVWTLLTILPFGPILGVVIPFVVGTVGFGAAIMTRVGTRSPARTHFVQG